ncbi:hypothetical protein HN873_026219, partial [Arachis hypogaea]
VVRNGDELDFSVGFSSASFPLDIFFVSPRCGCRLNCDDEDNDEFRVRKLKLRISCRQGVLNSVLVNQLHILIHDTVEWAMLCSMLAEISTSYFVL